MSTIKRKRYFMEHEQMDFETQIPGRCHYGAADAGEILATVDASRRAISSNGIRSGLRLVNGCRESPSSAPPRAIW